MHFIQFTPELLSFLSLTPCVANSSSSPLFPSSTRPLKYLQSPMSPMVLHWLPLSSAFYITLSLFSFKLIILSKTLHLQTTIHHSFQILSPPHSWWWRWDVFHISHCLPVGKQNWRHLLLTQAQLSRYRNLILDDPYVWLGKDFTDALLDTIHYLNLGDWLVPPVAKFSAYSPRDNKFWPAKMCVQTLGWIDARIYVMWKV